MLTYSHQRQTRVFPELCCSCDRIKLQGSSHPQVVFFWSTKPFFLYIRAIVNHLHCSRRSSSGWWMFIASERLLGFSNLQHCCFFCLGAEDALKHISFITSSDLPAGPVVSSDLYPICHVWEHVTLGEKMHFSNDSLLTGQ